VHSQGNTTNNPSVRDNHTRCRRKKGYHAQKPRTIASKNEPPSIAMYLHEQHTRT
jgi:hypothetical protein